MTMPAQKPGRSSQIVETPPEFLTAVRERFGDIVVDLAASDDNTVAPHWWGPGSPIEDALDPICSWVFSEGLCWLNPPYGNITPWAAKAAQQRDWGAKIAMLVPASVGSNWFNMYVRPFAYVFELSPRLTFVGHAHPYPKDLILALYTPERYVGRDSWHWCPSKAPANDNAASCNGVDPRQLHFPILEIA